MFKPAVGDVVVQRRRVCDGIALVPVESEGEVLAVVDHAEAVGGWAALVCWAGDFRAHEAFDFGEDAGLRRIRVKARQERADG